MERRTLITAAVAVLSGVAVIAGVVLLLPDPPTATTTSDPPPAAASASPEPTGTGAPGSAAPGLGDVGRSDAGIDAMAPDPVDDPVSVSMPELGVDLTVVPVGVRDDGQMDIPLLVSEAGWYRFGPAPGADRGAAVIAAHVASDRGAAPMAVLLDAAPGFTVEVTTRSGDVLRYSVDTVEQLGKDRLPLDALFTREGQHRLHLITCAGEWDPVAGAFEDNVVATATLIG